MTSTQSSSSGPVLSREEIARIEVGHTRVSPAVARALTVSCVVMLACVSVFEVVRSGSQGQPTAWRHLRGLATDVRSSTSQSDAGRWAEVVAANRAALSGLDAFETALEQESAVGRTLRPAAQLLLSGWLGAGNERVYVGRDGWLFYRPDVEYVTGAPFLDPRQQARRGAGAAEWGARPHPDPLAAIAQLKLDLDQRGITLVVVPTPVKATVHPEHLAAAYEDFDAPVQNASFTQMLQALRRDGILVVDPAPLLVQERVRSRQPQYLRTDTHWRPEAMQHVATVIAQVLTREAGVVPGNTTYQQQRAPVRHHGDTLRMLDLPADQQRSPPDVAETMRVLQSDGAPWQPTRGAEVLLLGDSFSNIYSLETMGWGSHAGLAEHVSAALRLPVDRLVQNDQGAFATRAMLQRVSATDPARLAHTRVVIYQFATRELAQGDWPLLPLTPE